jgi:glycosyltransferase involved in cell wall biosynthesis
VLVFPSRTDAFGPVVLGALAGGVPVAALPATGPRDVIGDALNDDLGKAWLVTLILSRKPLPCACGSR